ncbi:MAG: 30S ribosomal protein S9 [Candidatus Altiarchaeota archaeon]
MPKIVHRAGKRKTSIARATIKEGSGNLRINGIPLENIEPKAKRMKIEQCLMLASPYVDLKKLDIEVNVHGGGVMGQADAIANSIARALVDFSENENLLREYLSYDRTLIAGDHRLTEVHKPSQSSKGPRHRRQKSYR